MHYNKEREQLKKENFKTKTSKLPPAQRILKGPTSLRLTTRSNRDKAVESPARWQRNGKMQN